MGLDMYAWAVPATDDLPDTDFERPDGTDEFHYWRKHPNLHGWMEQLYSKKGGVREFNCTSVRLTLDDLGRLEGELGSLPETHGFFFGVSYGDEVDDDRRFIAQAREVISLGHAVYYSAWW